MRKGEKEKGRKGERRKGDQEMRQEII